jgi:predicted molibdopterin-dependent oxidoreductase YjgC
VVAGRGNLAESQEAATATLAALLDALTAAGASWSVLPALRRGNVVGALQLGMAPTQGVGGGLDVLRAAADGKLELLVLVGSDPLADCPDADLARRALAGARRVIAVDTFLTGSSERADVVLAACAYGEKDGTTTNLEGRVSSVVAKVTATGTSRPDWMIATELGLRLGHDLGFGSVDEVTDAIATEVPAYAGITPGAVAASIEGIVATAPIAFLPPASSSAGERNHYDYRLVVSRNLYDRAVGTVQSPSLAPLAPGPAALVHPLDLERVGVAVGTDVQLVSARSSVVLPLHTDPGVLRGTVRVRFNQGGGAVGELVDAGAAVTDVRIERL